MNANIRMCFVMLCICFFLFGCGSNIDSSEMGRSGSEKEDVSVSAVTEEMSVAQNQSESNMDDLVPKEQGEEILQTEKVYEWEERPDSESYRTINMLKKNGFPISYYIIFDDSNDPNVLEGVTPLYIKRQIMPTITWRWIMTHQSLKVALSKSFRQLMMLKQEPKI